MSCCKLTKVGSHFRFDSNIFFWKVPPFIFFPDEKVADNLLEGDIVLDPLNPDDYKLIKLVKQDKKIEAEDRMRKRQATRELKHLWHRRIVPYVIDSSLCK